jgi:large subunit ribosomal protein L5
MRLKERYKKEIAPALKKEFGYKNDMLVPRLSKVVINVGFGKNAKDKDVVTSVGQTLTKIAGQRPVFTKAKKSVSAFKIREGMVIGAMVTLRDKRMYDFVEKLVNITFPRVRDFRGISDVAVDKTGNLTVGFKENVAFPEIHLEDVSQTHGLEVIIVSTAKNRAEGLALFQKLGFPFKKN